MIGHCSTLIQFLSLSSTNPFLQTHPLTHFLEHGIGPTGFSQVNWQVELALHIEYTWLVPLQNSLTGKNFWAEAEKKRRY